MELICIVCPKGCHMTVDENGKVSGNTCKKGEAFAIAEKTCPMRTVCSTVATTFKYLPVLPVRTAGEIPKAKIPELMKLVNTVKVSKKVKRGDVILKNVLDCGVDLIATESIPD